MPVYIRVRDALTGHEFDIDEQSLTPEMDQVAGYPPNSGPGARPRPPKHRTTKDGKRSARRPQQTVAPTDPEPEGALPQ
jgi:hypothetical protein